MITSVTFKDPDTIDKPIAESMDYIPYVPALALRRDMPRVKFDMAAGEYFYADAGNGEEMFAIKVKRNDCFYVTLSAKSAGEAMDRAKSIVAEQNGVPLIFLDAEDYSR